MKTNVVQFIPAITLPKPQPVLFLHDIEFQTAASGIVYMSYGEPMEYTKEKFIIRGDTVFANANVFNVKYLHLFLMAVEGIDEEGKLTDTIIWPENGVEKFKNYEELN